MRPMTAIEWFVEQGGLTRENGQRFRGSDSVARQ